MRTWWWTAKAKQRAVEAGQSAAVLAETTAWGPARSRAAANNLTNSQAAHTLTQAMANFGDSIIQIGSLLAVKRNGGVMILTLSQAQINELERRPALFQDPATLLAELDRVIASAPPDNHDNADRDSD